MAFATIDVTKGITGTIPVANGGTGLTSGTADQYLKFTGTTTVASSALSGVGKIAQVIGGNSLSKYSTSSTSYTSIYSAPAITPSAATSKILFSWSCSMAYLSNTSNLGHIRVSRYINGGSETQLFDGGHNSSVYTYQAENNRQGYGLSFEFLDSPSTTGVLTYYVQFKTDNTGVTLYMNQNSGGQGGNMFVVLKEVLA